MRDRFDHQTGAWRSVPEAAIVQNRERSPDQPAVELTFDTSTQAFFIGIAVSVATTH